MKLFYKMYSHANSTTNTSKNMNGDWSPVRYPDREMWEKKRLGLDHTETRTPYFIRWDAKQHGKGKNRIYLPGYDFDFPPPDSSRTSCGCGYYLVDQKLAYKSMLTKGEFYDEIENPDSSSEYSDITLEDEDYEDEEEEEEEEDEYYEEEEDDEEDYTEDDEDYEKEDELAAARLEHEALVALKNQKEIRIEVDEQVEAMRKLVQKKKRKIERRQKKLDTKEKELRKLEKKLELEQAREELCRLKALKASTTIEDVYPQAPKKTSVPPKLRMKKRKLTFDDDTSTHNYNLRSRSRI